MLKSIRRKIKHLKSEDKAMQREHDIDENGNLVIDVVLNDAADAYSEFSPARDRRINPDLSEYILSENAIVPNPLHIAVYNDDLCEDKPAQVEFTKTLLMHFTGLRHKAYSQLRFNMIASLLCLLAGFAVIGLSVAFRFIFDYLEIIYVSIEIMAWVFMWEAVDLWFLTRPELKSKYYWLAKITETTIEFRKSEKQL